MPAVFFGTRNCSATSCSAPRCSLGVLRWRKCVLMWLRIDAFNRKTSSDLGNLKRDSTSPKNTDRRGIWRDHNKWLVDPRHEAMHWVRTRNWIPGARRWRGIGLAPFMDRNHWSVIVFKLLSQFHQTDGNNWIYVRKIVSKNLWLAETIHQNRPGDEVLRFVGYGGHVNNGIVQSTKALIVIFISHGAWSRSLRMRNSFINDFYLLEPSPKSHSCRRHGVGFFASHCAD